MGYDGARGADNKIHIHVGHGRMIYIFFYFSAKLKFCLIVFEMLVL